MAGVANTITFIVRRDTSGVRHKNRTIPASPCRETLRLRSAACLRRKHTPKVSCGRIRQTGLVDLGHLAILEI